VESCRVDGDAGASGGIFPIGNDHVDMMVLAQSRQQPAQSVPPRFADNIADKKKIHRRELNARRESGKSAFVNKPVIEARHFHFLTIS
jgi:Flp pilus assembly protein CpaB